MKKSILIPKYPLILMHQEISSWELVLKNVKEPARL